MRLNGQQVKELEEALLAAFPSRAELERMLRFQMDVALNHIAGNGSLREVVFAVIGWAEAQGRQAELVQAALNENPRSPALRALGARQTPPAGEGRANADFLIVTPLEEERDAVLAKLTGVRRVRPSPEDVRVYFSAEVPYAYEDGSGGTYRVIVCPLLGMGRVEAANATGDAIRQWSPRYVLLVGIAGGVAKAGVDLGDVLVSNQIADYELQKVYADRTEVRWQVHRVDPRLLGAAQNLLGNDWMQRIEVSRPEEGTPRRHVGVICTGDKVIANGLPAQYPETWAKLVGVEMEAGGVASAAFQAAQAPGFFMVRGVSDLADPEKDAPRVKGWRAYACDVAASYAMALIRSGPIPPANGTHV